MNFEGWISLGGLLLQLVVAAFVYGKLTGKVNEHDRRHDSHDTRFEELGKEEDRQWDMIGKHGEHISAHEARLNSLDRGR